MMTQKNSWPPPIKKLFLRLCYQYLGMCYTYLCITYLCNTIWAGWMLGTNLPQWLSNWR